jgi:hypothetical protein
MRALQSIADVALAFPEAVIRNHRNLAFRRSWRHEKPPLDARLCPMVAEHDVAVSSARDRGQQAHLKAFAQKTVPEDAVLVRSGLEGDTTRKSGASERSEQPIVILEIVLAINL